MKKTSFIARLGLGGVLVGGILGLANTQNNFFEIAKNIEIFTNVYRELNTYYVDEVEPAKLMRVGIDAMLGSLDPYTNYYSEAEVEGYKMQSTGKFGGIGIGVLPRKEGIVIASILDDSPAAKAGLQVGDMLIKVDGKTTKNKDTESIDAILKGSPDSKVKLVVQRVGSNKEEEMELTRLELKVPNVPYSDMLNNDIGYVTLTTFTEDAGANVEKAVQELKAKNQLKGLVFDLRGNGGGLLNEAVNILSVFVPKGEEVVWMKSKVKEWDKNFKTQNSPIDVNLPVTILINGRSASASEIVAGAMQDMDRGVLIGQKSYGKGLVQNTKMTGFNSQMKLTTAKYYIPSGRCIQAVQYKNGEPVEIADSLKNPFKTRSGRIVYDGGGIMPDVITNKNSDAPLIKELQAQHFIFDYATAYKLKKEKIASPKEYRLSDEEYKDFQAFVTQKGFTYNTKTDLVLKDLEVKTKEDGYQGALQTEINALRSRLNQEKKNEWVSYKKEIIQLLEAEIVSRYYNQRGRIEHNLAVDDEVSEAIKILNDQTRYKKLLTK